MTFPQLAAILDVLAHQVIAQAGVAQEERHVEVDAASLLHLLDKQVVALLRTARLAEHRNGAVLDGDHGLDGQHAAGKGRRFGDAAALLQVLQRIEQRDQADAALRIVELGGYLGRRHALLRQTYRICRQGFLPDGHVRGINHVHAASPRLRRGKRALVRARQLRGQRDDHRLVGAAGIGRAEHAFDNLRERERRHLAGTRKLVGLHQLLVKPVMGQVDAVQVLLIAERDGKRHNGAYAVKLALYQVRGRIGDDMHTRRAGAG